MESELYGLKWNQFKMVFKKKKTLTDPALHNLDTDPKEREPIDYPYMHTSVGADVPKLLEEFQESVSRESLVPLGAPLDYVPKGQTEQSGVTSERVNGRRALPQAN